MDRQLDQPRLLGLLCGSVAAGLGVLHLTVAGAPTHYAIVNVAALGLGYVLWRVAPMAAARSEGGAVLLLPVLLLTTTLWGAEVNGASRWTSVGPLTLQVSLITVPAVILLYARSPDATGTAGILVSAYALAAQPDRAMAAVLVAGTSIIVLDRPSRLSVLATSGAALSFGATMLQPDTVPAVLYVERVLFTAFEVHKLLGIAVVIGGLTLLVPTLCALRDGPDRRVLLAFGASWAALITASALGNYPTPLVGYGGSAVLGYLLSTALLPGWRQQVCGGDRMD